MPRQVTGCGVVWGLLLSLVGIPPAWGVFSPPQHRQWPQPTLRVPSTHLSIGLHYEKARPFRQGLAAVRQAGQWGYINPAGVWVIPPQFTLAGEFHGGLAPVSQQGRWGFINPQGEWVIPPQFTRVSPFSDGRATVWQDSLAGVISNQGEMILPVGRFRSIGEFREGRAAAMAPKGGWGVIDQHGNWVADPDFSSVGTFSEGLAAVAIAGKRGYINRQGDLVIPAQFEAALGFSHGLGLVSQGGKWGFINPAGQVVIPFRYDQAFSFAEGLAAVEHGGKQFYINQQGDPVLESPLNLGAGAALNFSNHLAPVGILGENEKWGYMDRAGQLVIPPQFERVTFFSEGLAAVAMGERWGYVARVSVAPNGLKGSDD